jgi:hypothetical protein
MARKFLTPIDLGKLELQNARIQNLSTAQKPVNPVEGQIYYDTDDKVVKTWNGTAWINASQGTQGVQGTVGSQGVQGTLGTQGVQGTLGTQGTQGTDGTQGTQGTDGTQGTQGTEGQQGTQGTDGTQGTQGTDGTQGTQGTDGTQGTQGTDGTQGTQGTDGTQGVQGTEGQQGVQGTEGQQGTQGTEGAQGTQGTDGTQGTEGSQGAQGAEGNFGGITVVYNFDDTVTMADPGDNNARLNNANPTLVTHLALDDNPADGNYDVSNFLQTIDDSTSPIKGHVKVSRKFDTATFYLYTISSATPSAPNWFDVEVAYVSGQGAFTDGEELLFTFARTGDVGAQGTQGTEGAQGVQGTVGAQGTQGTLGSQGTQGVQGVQGTEGQQGTQGTQGTVGSQGTLGTQGAVGSQGTVGAQGAQGTTGTQGVQGTQGTQGVQGTEGQQGVQGTEGQQGTQGSEGAQGTQGVQGAEGTQGTDGTQGATGTFGGETFEYNFIANTEDTDPGAGGFKFDFTNFGSVTELYIDNIDANSTDITSFLQTIDDSTSGIKGTFKVTKSGEPLNYAFFHIIGNHNENSGAYFTVPVAYVSGPLTLDTADVAYLTFARVGDKGDTGAQGTTGAQGVQGTVGSQGTQGTLGAQGTQGTQGVQGTTGSQGVQGSEGTQGVQGTEGQQGTQGTEGQQGTQGTDGTQGTQGTAALWNFTGAYNVGLPYAVGDVATYEGQTWYRKNANGGNVGDTPSEGTFWTLLAAQGVQGTDGTQGTQGTDGTQGTQGTDGTQGVQGTEGQQGTQGTNGTQGVQGTEGTQGVQGHSDRYKTTSTTSRAIAVANNVSFVLADPDLSYSVGQDVVVAYDVNNHMSATVVSYTSGTNTLVVNVNDIKGSGTYAVWSINLDGATGVQGTTGTQGTQGTDGIQGLDGVQGTQGTSGQLGTYAVTITGDSTDGGATGTTSFPVTHNLGTTDIMVTVWDAASKMEVVTDVAYVTTTSVTIGFAVAPITTKSYRVVVKA